MRPGQIDLNNFIEDMRACKPPYKCPFADCGKVYKTFAGIHTHILSHAGGNGSNAGSGSRTPIVPSSGRRSPADMQPFYKSPLKDTLYYNEADKTVEFESTEGKCFFGNLFTSLFLRFKDKLTYFIFFCLS